MTPLLGGIQFFESKAKEGIRKLTGHGFTSIYENLIQTVNTYAKPQP
jgi:hypothetical protein